MREFFLHLFTPHHSNNHRAKVLHIDALALYVVAFLMMQFVTRVGASRYPDILGFATDIRVEQLLALTNSKRQEAGLAPLVLNDRLSQAASGKAADMFAKNYWAHTSPDGKLPWDFILASGYRYTVAGENLAKNFNDSKGVVDAWMASSTHKDNLLKSSYKDIGFAVVNGTLNGEEMTLVVQMFGMSPQPMVITPPNESFVREVSAKEPVLAEPTVSPIPLRVLVTDQALATEQTAGSSGVPQIIFSRFQEVVRHPLVNLTRVNSLVSFVFLGILIVVLSMDAWLIARRRIVRVAGRSHAHLLFFIAILLILNVAIGGSVL